MHFTNLIISSFYKILSCPSVEMHFDSDECFTFTLIDSPLISIGDKVEIALPDQDDFTQGFSTELAVIKRFQ